MTPNDLYTVLESYFPKNVDLMRHLAINACWEYFITDHSTNEDTPKLHYYLYKKAEDSLIMTQEDPHIKADLVLYFTEKAILSLIQGYPNAEEYYDRYHNVMNNPLPGIEVDSKINKPRLKLWQLGYKNWQKDFKF